MRVLVCGGRDFADDKFLTDWLDVLDASLSFSVLIHGAARGADTLAGQWAARKNLPVEAYPADWDRYHKAAGAIRNAQMLKEGQPDLVVAFPHPSWSASRGTKNMVEQAKKAGLKCLVLM